MWNNASVGERACTARVELDYRGRDGTNDGKSQTYLSCHDLWRKGGGALEQRMQKDGRWGNEREGGREGGGSTWQTHLVYVNTTRQ